MDPHSLATEFELNPRNECIQGRTVACLLNTCSPSQELYTEHKTEWTGKPSEKVYSPSVVKKANASKWKT